MNVTDIHWDEIELPWATSEIVAELHDHQQNRTAFDLLNTMFAGQKALMEKYGDIERRNGCVVVEEGEFGEIDDRRVQMRLKDLMERTIEELMEAANCLKNKPWKNTFVATDKVHFDEELADAIHFFIELLITAGWDADKTFRMYFLKHAINQFRQRSNY